MSYKKRTFRKSHLNRRRKDGKPIGDHRNVWKVHSDPACDNGGYDKWLIEKYKLKKKAPTE